jgi:hypothetical protein
VLRHVLGARGGPLRTPQAARLAGARARLRRPGLFQSADQRALVPARGAGGSYAELRPKAHEPGADLPDRPRPQPGGLAEPGRPPAQPGAHQAAGGPCATRCASSCRRATPLSTPSPRNSASRPRPSSAASPSRG